MRFFLANGLLGAVLVLIVVVSGCDSSDPQREALSLQRASVLGDWSRPYVDSHLEMLLRHDGRYELEIVGLRTVTGTWTFDDRELLAVEDFACAGVGLYNFEIEEGALLLSPVQDNCNRAGFLEGRWIRNGNEQ